MKYAGRLTLLGLVSFMSLISCGKKGGDNTPTNVDLNNIAFVEDDIIQKSFDVV